MKFECWIDEGADWQALRVVEAADYLDAAEAYADGLDSDGFFDEGYDETPVVNVRDEVGTVRRVRYEIDFDVTFNAYEVTP
jgi:hypothetical protein